jgi:Zn-dependent peptidase ImmA (M78 family)
MVPLVVAELVDLFWREVGRPEAFPRRLRDSLRWTSFDLTIEELPGLTTRGVEKILARSGCPRSLAGPDRSLRGCLLADNGAGWIFLDANDGLPERTFTLAHELAHFLADYWQPRQRAVAVLGPGILEVLDARRPATLAERLHALLRETPLGSHLHLMDRPTDHVNVAVNRAEDRADRLALELLAPAEEVLRRLEGEANRVVAERVLVEEFGLPLTLARPYAQILIPPPRRFPWLDRLQNAQNSCRTSANKQEDKAGGARDEQQSA